MSDQKTEKVYKPRQRQYKVAEALIENMRSAKPKPVGQLLETVGYSKNSAEMPTRVTESKGVKKALAELGLTEELVTNALVEDIEKKPQKRLGELNLAAEILGMKKPIVQSIPVSNTYNFIFDAEFRQQIRPIEEKLIEQFKNYDPTQKTIQALEAEQQNGSTTEAY